MTKYDLSSVRAAMLRCMQDLLKVCEKLAATVEELDAKKPH